MEVLLKMFLSELTDEEKKLLSEYEPFYRALEEGSYKPTTKAQKRFISVCKGLASPSTPHEIVWLKVKESAQAESGLKPNLIDEEIEGAIKDEIKSKEDFVRSNKARSYILSTF